MISLATPAPEKESKPEAPKPAQQQPQQQNQQPQQGKQNQQQPQGGQQQRQKFQNNQQNNRPRVPEFEGTVVATGVLEIMPDGYGFLRSSDYNYLNSPDDIYVSQQQIKFNALKSGDTVTGEIRPPREGDKYFPLVRILSVNGRSIEFIRDRVPFDFLTPLFPDKKFNLTGGASNKDISCRIVDMFAPIGKGQRMLIVSPPKAGKTLLLKSIANAIADNHPEVYEIVLLVDERPEEVTDMQRSVKAEVVASTFDEPAEKHVKVANMVIEKARRLVECGHDVVILLDSITRLARAYTFTLPNISFSMSTVYPFKQKNRVGKERFYERISFGYSTALQNKINFKASEFALNSSMLDRFQNGMSHNFNIGLPNFQILKYISFAPSVSYSQNWFFRKTEYFYNPETDAVESKLGRQFGTLGITQNYSVSASMSTRLYGMFNFGKHHKIQAIRHVVSPSMSVSWSPDKATYANGYRTLSYTDASGAVKNYDYNIYSGQMYSPPGRGQSATASLSIGNNLEAKVRDYADTTGTGTKKVKLIDQLSLNGSYNFLADSLKLSSISMSMSTTLFNKITISASAGFDPYAISDRNTRYNRFAITQGQGLVRLTNFSASASYSITGKGKMNGYDGTGQDGRGSAGSGSYYQRIYYHPVTGEYIPEGWLYYTNPDVPWSLNFSGSFSLFRAYTYNKETTRLDHKNNITATLTTSGNIKLTPKLSVNMSSGFDFVAMKITTTSISANYDLHCFNIAVSWIPTGKWKSYSFRIAANAAALADLLRFKKSDSYWDN